MKVYGPLLTENYESGRSEIKSVCWLVSDTIHVPQSRDQSIPLTEIYIGLRKIHLRCFVRAKHILLTLLRIRNLK